MKKYMNIVPKITVEKLEGNIPFDTDVQGRILLKRIIRNSASQRDIDSFGFEQGQTTRSCEHVKESSWYNKGE